MQFQRPHSPSGKKEISQTPSIQTQKTHSISETSDSKITTPRMRAARSIEKPFPPASSSPANQNPTTKTKPAPLIDTTLRNLSKAQQTLILAVRWAQTDISQALHLLELSNQSHSNSDKKKASRFGVALASVLLKAGRIRAAMSAAVQTLALARETADLRAESATLCNLAACFRAMGRVSEARRLQALAYEILKI